MPSVHSSAEKTQPESPKDMILKMRECHNNPTVNGVWTDSVDITMAPTTQPCGQRRARSGRLRSHGHRALSLPSVKWRSNKQLDNPQGAWTRKATGTLGFRVRCTNTSFLFPSRWFTFNDTHMRGSSRKFGVRSAHSMRHLHALMLCVWFSATSPLSSPCCLSSHLSSCFPPGHQLLHPRCGGQIPCALQLMRTLAPLPSTTLSQVMSPTTTTSRRLLNRTSRNPSARTGPWTRMTLRTMTTTSAWRSLHHCSPKSEKMMRAVDELITLMTKVCRPASRRLSVIERGDPLWNSLTHKSQTSEEIRAQLRKWANQDSSGTTKRADSRWLSGRDSKTRVPGRIWQKKYSKIEWNDRVSKRRNLSCSSRRRTTSTRSTTSSWTITGTKSGSSRSSWEKSQWDGRIEEVSNLYIRYNFEEKIDRRWRHCPWTHRQDSGTTEWN